MSGDGARARLWAFFGVDLYTDAGRMRADDTLVRGQVDHAVVDAAAAVRAAAADYRATRIPSATREHPFPPADALARLRSAERVAVELGELSALLRAAGVLQRDRVWQRWRSGDLSALLPLDLEMVEQGELLRATAAGLAGTDLEEAALAGVRTAAAVIRSTLDQRSRLLDSAWGGAG